MRNKVTNWSCEDNTIRLITANGAMQIEVLENAIVHFQFHFQNEEDKPLYYSREKSPWGDLTPVPSLPLVPEQDGETLRIKASVFNVEIDLQQLALTIRDPDGWIQMQDVADLCYLKDRNNRRQHIVYMEHDQLCFGFGERSGKLNKNGRRLKVSNLDAWGYNAEYTDPLYVSIPFFIRLDPATKKACGVFYCSTNPCSFDMGMERCHYHEDYYQYHVDDGDINGYLIAGPMIRDVLERYTALTGRTPMPPDYSLGNIASAMYFAETEARSDLEELAYADRFSMYDFPCDFMYLSSGYFSDTEGRRLAFEWNSKRFPDPNWFVEEMLKKNIHICANVKPGILTSHPRYEEFRQKGLFVRNGDGEAAQTSYWGGKGSYLDFISEAGREIWKEMLKERIVKNGILDIWNDNCEFEIEETGANCGSDQSVDHEGVRLVLPNIMARMAREAIAEVNKDHRPYIVNRAGSFGIQKYAQTWSGDNVGNWHSLKYNIPMMLGLGLSGVANNACDIGGFAGDRISEELLVRWVQNGIFQPRFCIHCSKQDNSVTEPWMYESTMPIIRDALHLRYRLLPYLYTLFYESSKNGAPIMRPMVYEFQNDPTLMHEDFDFMFGPWLLVANVLEEGARKRNIYLPEGNWYSWEKAQPYNGGQVIEVDAPLHLIPLFIREGAIIPMNVNSHSPIRLGDQQVVELLISGGVDSSYDIYFDDGRTNNYLNGDYTLLRVDQTKTSIRISQVGIPPLTLKNLRLQIISPHGIPCKIALNGKNTMRVFSAKELRCDETWFFNNDTNRLEILISHTPQEQTLEFVLPARRAAIGM